MENLGNVILIVILLVACVGMFMLSYFRNKKYNDQQQKMHEEIKVGAKVLTKTFIYGVVEKITDTTDGKIVLLKTGEGDKVSYLEMNIEAIYSIDNKEEVVDMEEVTEVAFKEEEKVVTENKEEKEAEVKKAKKVTKKTTKK